ncbi:hypothetical protein ABB37_04522 [Leptomonas pyrrhocoris]|uniref:Uncharacterized protein n=1 Tax=Leptomonas pyrrhocoris TaxID=157538 RepID=A0A0N0DW18_LEPPY|nr:hypothetical protein ABB37_04522 [Leptomonas pyrrhocoris]KPA81184.1 hypothetical protein ABB37_04522 [Leptomonas pyrrhocoris]|eukprot:XP_015659623.1 hypothetical protein ABB37_04522 [Leptomonas pyrrhocoris]
MALVESLVGTAVEGSTRLVPSALFLLTPSQLSAALYGLVACAIKMGSVLQEMVLALRHDTRRFLLSSSGSSSGGASVLADYLSSVLAREGRLNAEGAALLPLHELNDEKEVGAPPGMGLVNGMNGAPLDPLTLVEAVGMLESFVETRWSLCRNVYLSEESDILLANV